MSTGITNAVRHFLGYVDTICLCGRSLPFESVEYLLGVNLEYSRPLATPT